MGPAFGFGIACFFVGSMSGLVLGALLLPLLALARA